MGSGDRVLFLWEGEGEGGEGEREKEKEKGEKKERKGRRHKTRPTTKRLSIPIQLNSILANQNTAYRLPPPPTHPSSPTPLTPPQPNTTSHRHFLHNNNTQSTPLISALPFPSRPLSIQSLATFQQFRTQSPNSKPHGSSDFNDRRDLKIGSSAKVCGIWGWGVRMSGIGCEGGRGGGCVCHMLSDLACCKKASCEKSLQV